MTHRTWESAVLTITVLLLELQITASQRERVTGWNLGGEGGQTWSLLISLWGPNALTSYQLVIVLRGIATWKVHLSSAPTTPTEGFFTWTWLIESVSSLPPFPCEVEITVCLHVCVYDMCLCVCLSVCLPSHAVVSNCLWPHYNTSTF